MPKPHPRSISVCSGKGGTGKTTLTANLGVSLASLGRKVVIMDADLAMANLSIVMGLRKCDVTLFDVLKGEAEIGQALYENYGVKVLPTGFRFEDVQEMLGKVRRERVEEVVRELLSRTEILLIDAPAGIQEATIFSLAASRETIAVSLPSYPSLVDCYKTVRLANLLRTWPRGLVLNRVGGEYLDRSEVQAFMDRAVKGIPILAEIPEDPKVREAEMEGVPAVVYEPSSPASQAIRHLASVVAGEADLPYVPIEEREVRETTRRLLAALTG